MLNMADLIIVEKDLRNEPPTYEVTLSDDLREKAKARMNHIGKFGVSELTHFYHAFSLDDHLVLREQVNLTNTTDLFGISHDSLEADGRLRGKAMEYANELGARIERAIDIKPDIVERFYPHKDFKR